MILMLQLCGMYHQWKLDKKYSRLFYSKCYMMSLSVLLLFLQRKTEILIQSITSGNKKIKENINVHKCVFEWSTAPRQIFSFYPTGNIIIKNTAPNDCLVLYLPYLTTIIVFSTGYQFSKRISKSITIYYLIEICLQKTSIFIR